MEIFFWLRELAGVFFLGGLGVYIWSFFIGTDADAARDTAKVLAKSSTKETRELDFKGINFEGDILLQETANILGDLIKVKKDPNLAKVTNNVTGKVN